ncbi:MAG TPA: DnaJ C-terminal domain-containing protein [Hyphomicrobiaceae bacterium]|jgi:DnaJ-class molecular chaperone|nr:DnaJ C-terminal domain-containing protein [Hyphomicrobiaceae bacterium]
MADDPYTVLGVPRSATEDDIRRAYRKLAKELHPDLNPANRASAEERFKKVSAAYGVIGDPEKRRQYDRGEIDASGEPRRGFRRPPGGGPFEGHPGGPRTPDDFSFGDIFTDLFGTMRGRGEPGSPFGVRGRDARYSLDIDFLEAAQGAKKRVSLPDSGALDIAVPQGVVDGQVLRLKGRGAAGRRGAEPGDALVEIRVRPHPYFKRVDDDISIDVPITIDEAALGAKIEVPTIAGRVQLTLPKATSSGRIFRLKGRGVHNVTTGHTGDQLVTVRIVLPDTVDDELSYFLSEWRQKHKYDPGRP